jgi:flagellar protein FlbT
MPGLALKLSPQERFLVNGVVLQNGPRRAMVSILSPDTNVLRMKEAIHPEDANTPVSRVAYIAQLILTGDADPNEARFQLLQGIEQLSQVLNDTDSRAKLDLATSLVAEDKYYPVFKTLRALLSREQRLFEMAAKVS